MKDQKIWIRDVIKVEQIPDQGTTCFGCGKNKIMIPMTREGLNGKEETFFMRKKNSMFKVYDRYGATILCSRCLKNAGIDSATYLPPKEDRWIILRKGR